LPGQPNCNYALVFYGESKRVPLDNGKRGDNLVELRLQCLHATCVNLAERHALVIYINIRHVNNARIYLFLNLPFACFSRNLVAAPLQPLVIVCVIFACHWFALTLQLSR
jgi:hypothetical protein